MIIILGAGLSGLSVSYHLGHDRCLLLERNEHAFGHIKSTKRDGFTWDQGPHVSFTKHNYVRELLCENVEDEFEDIEVKVSNYFYGHWITHPAQTSLYQLPESIRKECLDSFLKSRSELSDVTTISNYQLWLEYAFGPVFANTFSKAYTDKYWTRSPNELTTDWIGERVLFPKIEDVKRGARGPLDVSMHYISRVRYPSNGGYQSFAEKLSVGANIKYGAEVTAIDLDERLVYLANGQCHFYDKLINTLPLPLFVNYCKNVPAIVSDATRQLSCSQLLLINIAVPHESQRPEHWIYVYDSEKLSSRISITEKMSPNNAPDGWTGIQVEVYFSRHRPLPAAPNIIAEQVKQELIQMGLINPSRFKPGFSVHHHITYSHWANVIFDHETSPSLEIIWSWLKNKGLQRELGDTHPLTNWDTLAGEPHQKSTLYMAGRFGQWKYFWTDDCILRGKYLANLVSE